MEDRTSHRLLAVISAVDTIVPDCESGHIREAKRTVKEVKESLADIVQERQLSGGHKA